MTHFNDSSVEEHLKHKHYSHRMGWLRAAVLGANDGIISVVAVLVGVIAAGVGREEVLIVGVAALVAGALSMAAGEYVSVSSQSDTEKADLEIERKLLNDHWDREVDELTLIYQERGVSESTARQVAIELMNHDALEAHARDELGLSDIHSARPMQAALASALAFVAGAGIPVLLVALLPLENLGWIIASVSLFLLAILGALAAWVGGASLWLGSFRVLIWGALTMAITTYVGFVFNVAG